MAVPLPVRAPDFSQLEKVLSGRAPDRPVLFEFFLHPDLYNELAGPGHDAHRPDADGLRALAGASLRAGYDYVTVPGHYVGQFAFPTNERKHEGAQSVSMNEGVVIHDRDSFNRYAWPDPADTDLSGLAAVAPELPKGARFMPCMPGGILENAMSLAGYEGLAVLVAEEDPLAADIFNAIGERELAYAKRVLAQPGTGLLMYNDDWGFKSQTMLSPADMRRYVFPWVKKIVHAAHEANCPAVLHSCGNLDEIMEDIIAMGFSGKHSFEDAIEPIEDAWKRWGRRIATLGGIDLDFICRSPVAAVTARAQALVDGPGRQGGYALGSGNSIAPYVPWPAYYAMIRPALRETY